MRFNLAALWRRARNPRRREVVFRDIVPPAVRATDLYRSVYAPIVERIRSAAPMLEAEYARSLDQVTRDSAFDLNALFEALEADLSRLFIELTPRLRDWTVRFEQWQRGKWVASALSATGVDLQTMLGPEDVRETLETFIARNVALMKDVGAEARQKMSEAVYQGLTSRTPAREVAARLREIADIERRRSIRIAGDQLQKAAAALSSERRRQAGLTIFKHRHSGKLHPRTRHLERDGKLFSEDAGDVGRTVNGQAVHQAPPPDDRCGVPPFCGCRELACLVLD